MEKPKLNNYLFAGTLVDRTRKPVSSKETYENSDVKVMLSIFKRNKVPLITALNTELSETYPEFFITSKFKTQYEKEHAEFQNLRNEWAKVRNEFLKAGIESILIKSIGSFPYKSSNLDVLIKQIKRERAESILKDMGYIQLHNVEEPYKTLFRKFAGGKSISVIHLHNKVAWINSFHDEELLWSRYRNSSKDDLIDIPSPEDSILILTAHWFYEDKEIKLSDIMNISTCLNERKLDWQYMISVAEKIGWLNGFYFGLLVQSFVEKNLYGMSSIKNEQIEKMITALPFWMRTYLEKKIYSRKVSLPFILPKFFGKYLHFVKTLKDKTTSPARKLHEIYKVAQSSLFVILFYKFKCNIRYQPSMLISISGVDGSGKSTYADVLYEILIFCELKTRIVWSRVGSSFFLKPLSKISKILYSLKSQKSFSNPADSFNESEMRRKEQLKKSFMIRTIVLSFLLLEMLWQYSFKVALPLLLNKVVICDRYVYDTIVDLNTRYGINPNTTEGKLFKKILIALTPKTDIAYALFIPFEEACSRKKVDMRERHLVMDQIRSYREIANAYNILQINTDDDKAITDISNKMIYEILKCYYGMWAAKNSSTNDIDTI